jgi:hypothetical protein
MLRHGEVHYAPAFMRHYQKDIKDLEANRGNGEKVRGY